MYELEAKACDIFPSVFCYSGISGTVVTLSSCCLEGVQLREIYSSLFSGVDCYKIHAVDSGSPDEGKKAPLLAVQGVHILSRSDVRESQSSPQEEGRRLGAVVVPVAVIKYPEKNSLKKNGFNLAHSSRLTVHHGRTVTGTRRLRGVVTLQS